jgi:carbon starvation protein
LFGIANQMLAAIALCLGTTIILKMALQRRAGVAPAPNLKDSAKGAGMKFETGATPVLRSPRLALVTLIPLVWLVAVTFTAGVEKIWHPDPRIGFLAQADSLWQKNRELQQIHIKANHDLMMFAATNYAKQKDAEFSAKLAALQKVCYETWQPVVDNDAQQFNNRLDAAVTGIFLVLVTAIILLSAREWILLLTRRKPAVLHETEPVWLPDYALKEAGPNLRTVAGTAALAFGLAKELSGESHFERARQQACVFERHSDAQIFAQVTEDRFNGVRRCC